MRLTHDDKSIGPEGTKHSPAVEAGIRAQTALLGLTPDEANEVGFAVAVAAERASSPTWIDRFARSGDPTPAEQAELDRATAAWQAAHQQTEFHRLAAQLAAEEADRLFREGYDSDNRSEHDRRELDVARGRARETHHALDLACEAEKHLDGPVVRARGAIWHGAVNRQREHAARGL